MTAAGRWYRWCRTRLAAPKVGGRLALAGAAVLVLAGLGWLALGGAERMVPVLDRPLSPSELAEAKDALAERGIDHRMDAGRLVVPRGSLHEARSALREAALDAGGESAGLEQLVRKEDIWSSQSQLSKRWQAAKMAAMARLIRRFPQVRSASVIFEEGESRGLGGGGAEPTAVVGVELKTGSAMTPELVDAIADLVAGGVAGMKRQNVRIVEGSGRSYRATEAALAESPALRELQAAEAYYAAKVRSSIPRIEGAVVAVRVEPHEPVPRCAEVRVSIPRSHFVAAARVAAGESRPDEAAIQAVIAAGLEQVQDMVASALGEKDSPRIQAECYADAADAAGAFAASPAARAEGSWVPWAAGVIGAAAVGVLWAAAGGVLRRRRSGAAGQSAGHGNPGADFSAGVLGALQRASVEDILSLVGDEHPQMAAVVLVSLPADKAGAVLAALPPSLQREVARRIVAMEQIDPKMLGEVYREIGRRLAALGKGGGPAGPQGAIAAPPAGGAGKLADLLHRAGPQTRRNVLEALWRELPDLAEGLRRAPLAFEDIASLGESRLAVVLEDMDGRRLAVALRTASKDLVQRIFACLSSPAARRLRAHMERIGPVRLSEVESAQQQIVEELLAAEAGQYAQAAPGDEQIVATGPVADGQAA